MKVVRFWFAVRRAPVFAAAVLLAVLVGAADLSAQEGASDESGIRMMLKVQIPTEAGNEAIANGTMGQIFQDLIDKIKPEAAYFSQEDGYRTAYFVYMLDSSMAFAEIHEPLMQGLGARVYDQPAETWEDLQGALKSIDE